MTGPSVYWSGDTLHLSGTLSIAHVEKIVLPPEARARRILLTDLIRLDTAGAWRLLEMSDRLGAQIEGAARPMPP